MKETPPGASRRPRPADEPRRNAEPEPALEVSSWRPPGQARVRETQRAAHTLAAPSNASPAAAELVASLARLRQRFRDVTAVVEGLGGLRSLGGEEALIEMAMFAQSHEHTLELAWEALGDCEALARQLQSGSLPPGESTPSNPVSSAPSATERAPKTAEPELAAPAVPVAEGEDDEGHVTQVDIAPVRVLVVDDDPAVLRAFKRVLAGDHEVLTARDGAEALRLVLGGERVDAIICDIGMPKLDGPAFFSELFELRPQMMPRVVFCTGGQPNEKTQRFLERLQAPLLYKPVAVHELRQAIDSVRSR